MSKSQDAPKPAAGKPFFPPVAPEWLPRCGACGQLLPHVRECK